MRADCRSKQIVVKTLRRNAFTSFILFVRLRVRKVKRKKKVALKVTLRKLMKRMKWMARKRRRRKRYAVFLILNLFILGLIPQSCSDSILLFNIYKRCSRPHLQPAQDGTTEFWARLNLPPVSRVPFSILDLCPWQSSVALRLILL